MTRIQINVHRKLLHNVKTIRLDEAARAEEQAVGFGGPVVFVWQTLQLPSR